MGAARLHARRSHAVHARGQRGAGMVRPDPAPGSRRVRVPRAARILSGRFGRPCRGAPSDGRTGPPRVETAVTRLPCIRKFPDPDSLSREAADFMLACSRRVLASRERFTVALSGGATPKKLYSLLAAPPWRDAFPWPGTHIFWSDGRCVPPGNPESNYKLAFDGFLSRLPLPAQNIHRIRGEAGPDEAARGYEKELWSFFGEDTLPRFDLVLLGVGEDGHTASLFPGAGALQEQNRLALPVRVDPPGLNRVTLSLRVLNNAARVLFLAAGGSKAKVVREIAAEGNRRGYPAGLVRPAHGTLVWMIDQEAGSQLREVAVEED